MLGKKPKPVIEILTGSFVPGNKSGSTSPKSPRTFDNGAVGLRIVAELEKTGDLLANRSFFSRNLSRSIPIPVKNSYTKNSEEMVMESFEEYTIVTCHGPNNSYTKVYGDGRKGNDRSPFRIQQEYVRKNKRPSVFHISPLKSEDIAIVPPYDFLSSCDLCNKKLHNEDIYMYRGEKAFCSTECRYKQMVMDERKEKYCSQENSIRAPVEVASSPYTNGGQIFTTGILAT